MKIQAINNYSINTVNFEGKKTKNTQEAMHTATPIKAIPVALLLAMSPVTIPKATAQVSPILLEQIQRTEDTVEREDICLKATPDGNYGKIKMYMSRDGEEYIKLNLFKESNTFAINEKGENINAIKTTKIDIRPEEFLIETTSYSGRGMSSKETKYYVVGSGIGYVTQVRDAKTGKPVQKAYHDDILKIESQRFEITEDFYNLISQNPYNTAPTTKENKLVVSSGVR